MYESDSEVRGLEFGCSFIYWTFYVFLFVSVVNVFVYLWQLSVTIILRCPLCVAYVYKMLPLRMAGREVKHTQWFEIDLE